MTPVGEGIQFDWRRVAAASGALVATLFLLAMVVLVAISNQARDSALNAERHAYDVNLLTRSVDAAMAKAEAGLGRFVLDEDQQGSGNIYYSNWRLAGLQVNQLERLLRNNPRQAARVRDLKAIYVERGVQFDLAARATVEGTGLNGAGYFYTAAKSDVGKRLTLKLNEIANAERVALRERMAQTQIFSARADRLTDYLSWLGLIVGVGAIFLGVVAIQAIRDFAAARRLAESETERAEALEEAVAERTYELREANEALRAEAEERQAAEAQLRQVQKMEAVGQLTGGIAHDFNNMLAVVVGGIDLARRRLNGPRREVMVHLNNAMEGATRAAALTRRLLSFARSEPLLPERVDPAELVAGMSDLLDRTLGERVHVEVDLDRDTWPAYVDPHQFENAMVNLAVNARDAMDAQGVMRISTENVTLGANEVGDVQPGDYVRISVSDTGCGMTPEVMERAFEPFFTTKPVGKGTGLGLSQIFGFAHQSGGEVGIESEVGRGTTVSIYLPRSHAAAAKVRLHPAAQRSDAEPAMAPSTAKVLVVEDDPRVRAATVGALEDLDYEPIACSSGAEALRLFEQQDFDLVISDVIMPEMTGPELIRNVTERHPGIAVLFVTGYVGENESEDLAGYELLRKPFTVGALANAVTAALTRDASAPRRSGGAVAAR